MDNYIKSETGEKVSLTKIEKQNKKRLFCPYCCESFNAGEIAFRATKDFSDIEITEKENELRSVGSGVSSENVGKILQEYKKFRKIKHEKFKNICRDNKWLGSNIYENSSGYFAKDDSVNSSGSEGVKVEEVEFCVLDQRNMKELVYDNSGYILGAREDREGYPVSRKKMCPHCYCILPPDYGKWDTKVIAVLGVRGTGKTVFLAQLLKNIEDLFSKLGMYVPQTVEDTASRFAEKFAVKVKEENKYSGTPTGTSCPPILLRMAKKERDELNTLILYDIAGEHCENADYMNAHGKFVLKADGIIVLISPEEIKRNSATSGIAFDKNDLLSSESADDKAGVLPKNHKFVSIGVVLNTIYSSANFLIRRRLCKKVPLAVTLSKSDVYSRAKYPDGSLVCQQNSDMQKNVIYSPVRNGFMHDQQARISEEVLKVLKSAALDAAVSRYNKKKYFACSAIGCSINDVKQGKEPETKRIEEAFSWIMSEWGWIDALDDNGNIIRKREWSLLNLINRR